MPTTPVNWTELNWFELDWTELSICALVSDLSVHDAVKADWTLKVESTNPPPTILGSAPLWFMAPFLLLRSVIPLPTDTCWLGNAKVLAMIRYISRNVSWNLLSNRFPQKWIEKEKKKKKNADLEQTHSCRLLADRVMNENLFPGLSASRTDGASHSNPDYNLFPHNYTQTPLKRSTRRHTYIHLTWLHDKGMWNCLFHKSRIHDNLFCISESDLPSQPLPLSVSAAIFKRASKLVFDCAKTSKQHYATACNTKWTVRHSSAHKEFWELINILISLINKKSQRRKNLKETSINADKQITARTMWCNAIRKSVSDSVKRQ